MKVDEALARLKDPDYWRSLDPTLPISTRPPSRQPEMTLRATDFGLARERMRTEGYFMVRPLIPRSTLDTVKQAMATVEAAGWLPVFSFLYDAPWIASRLGPVQRLAGGILDYGFRQLPDFWAYHVHTDSRGYRPHREVGPEMLLADGNPKSITIWLPLNDATLDNGCMYIIPMDLENDATSTTTDVIASEYGKNPDLGVMLHRVRALPTAGALLTWNHAIMHWGSFASPRATHPRMSIAFEFIRQDVDPGVHPHARLPDDVPPHEPIALDPSGNLPTFEQRVFFIANNIRRYYGWRGKSEAYQYMAWNLMSRGFPEA